MNSTFFLSCHGVDRFWSGFLAKIFLLVLEVCITNEYFRSEISTLLPSVNRNVVCLIINFWQKLFSTRLIKYDCVYSFRMIDRYLLLTFAQELL